MERTCSYDICTGCGVCFTVCPQKCISFVTGDFGHIFPKIDTSRCIDCKKCERVCPALKDNSKKYPLVCNAGLIKNPIDYKTTTSGGAAQAISLYILQQGGVVFGCASLPGGEVRHVKVDNQNDLELLKGSKYVQSTAWKVFDELVVEVKNDRLVLFIGTPCQCAAVKALFLKKPDNLLIVDLVCHGVPSQKFLSDYLRKKNIELSEVYKLKFRTDKGYQLVVYDNIQNTIYSTTPLFSRYFVDLYYGLFFWGFSSRKSCYNCQFACPERCSDITIGDFWGLGKKQSCDEIPEHTKGISLILSNTEEGNRVISGVREIINLYPRPVEEAIAGNDQLRHPKKLDKKIKVFNFLRKLLGIRVAFRIVTFHKVIKTIIKKNILRR